MQLVYHCGSSHAVAHNRLHFFLPKTVGMFEFLGSKGDSRGEQVIFSDFKYHLQKMLKSKNLLQFNVSKIILRYFTAYTA